MKPHLFILIALLLSGAAFGQDAPPQPESIPVLQARVAALQAQLAEAQAMASALNTLLEEAIHKQPTKEDIQAYMRQINASQKARAAEVALNVVIEQEKKKTATPSQ